MSGMAHGARTDPREGVVFAIILITVGIGALAAQSMPEVGGLVVTLIGLALLAIFAFLRHYALLVPGGIMTGLGVGIIAAEQLTLADEAQGGVIVLGLGLGFLSIWVIGALAHVEEHRPWPLIPGGILSVIGAALIVGGTAGDLIQYWPVILIAIGLVVLWRAVVEVRARP